MFGLAFMIGCSYGLGVYTGLHFNDNHIHTNPIETPTEEVDIPNKPNPPII